LKPARNNGSGIAVGVRVLELPMVPERILAALKQAQS
jgi:hypothetical protein